MRKYNSIYDFWAVGEWYLAVTHQSYTSPAMLTSLLLSSLTSALLACGPSVPAPPPVFHPTLQFTSFMPRSSTRQATFPLFSRSIPQRRPARPANPVRDSPYSFEIPASRLNQLSPPVRRNNGFSEQLISDPSFHFIFSPPVSWTYCEPSCGTGDQGIDQESAYDNAVVDVREAINAAFADLGFGPIGEHNIHFDYVPANMLLRDFNSQFFDENGAQFLTVGKTVRQETHRNDFSAFTVAHNATLRIRDSYTFSMSFWEKVGILFRKHLLPKGVEVNRGPSLNRAAVEKTTFNRRMNFYVAPVLVPPASPPRARTAPFEERREPIAESSAEEIEELLTNETETFSTALNTSLCNDC